LACEVLLLLILTPPPMDAATVLLLLLCLLVSVVLVQRGTYAAAPAAESGHEVHKRVQLLVQVWNLPVWAGGDSDTQKIAAAAAAAAAVAVAACAATILGLINHKGFGAVGMSMIPSSCGVSYHGDQQFGTSR
jgi:hypothetical protein